MQKYVPVDEKIVDQIKGDIFQEIYKAGKIPDSRLLRQLLRNVLHKPVNNFSQFVARLDALIREFGFVEAARVAINELSGGSRSFGMERIPVHGPLIIASNHPGTYDGFALIKNFKREDLKIIVSGVPFFRNLPHASKYLIYSTQDVHDRTQAIRNSVAHLQKGGAVLIFPSGRIDPDPAVLPGADKALSMWSQSVLLFLRKVPSASLILAITSGVLSKEFAQHPYPKLFRNDHERRRVMEFMQVIKQMVRGKPVSVDPCVSFSKPIPINMHSKSVEEMRKQILAQATALLSRHKMEFSLPQF